MKVTKLITASAAAAFALMPMISTPSHAGDYADKLECTMDVDCWANSLEKDGKNTWIEPGSKAITKQIRKLSTDGGYCPRGCTSER